LDLHGSGPDVDSGRTDNPSKPRDDGAPRQVAGGPADEAAVPGDEAAVPAEQAGIPAEQAGVPAEETGVPAEQAGVPGEETGGPGEDAGAAAAGRPPNSRTGRNLPVAAAVGLGLGALAVVTLFTVKSSFLLLMGVAIAIAVWELGRALRVRQIAIPLVPVYAGGAAVYTCAYWLGYRAMLAALALTMIGVLAWRLAGPAAGFLRDVTAGMFAVVYLPLAGAFVALMLSAPDGAHRAFLFLVVTVCSDIGGYFAGISFGKHLLVPRISPKKTWEGFAGSALACLAAGGALLPVLLHGHVWQGLILGAAVVAVATLGDLVESMIKRDLGIKDMGSLLPGHGGVLDRIDAMLLSAPVTWLLLTVFIPH
jgi:phosphatidate cytidylyltransferase